MQRCGFGAATSTRQRGTALSFERSFEPSLEAAGKLLVLPLPHGSFPEDHPHPRMM